jgi:iron complex outermembrane receptor protein
VDWLRDFYNKSVSGYAHADFDVTEKLKVQGGLRYEQDKVNYLWTFLPLLATTKMTTAGLKTLPDINVLKVSSNSDSDSFVNFDAGAQYKITPDIMSYVTYSQASQGPIFDSEDNLVAFGPSAMSPVTGKLQVLPQEHVKNVEAGFKSQLFDRRLTLNVSAYYAKYLNYQVQTNVPNPDPNAPPTLKVASVGQVRTTGMEFNAAARITEHLRGDFNASYTIARILDFPNAPCYNGSTVGVDGCVRVGTGAAAYNTQGNLAGELLNRAPKIRFTTSLEYSHPIGSGDLEFYVTPLLKYATAQRTDLLRLPTSYIPTTKIVDLNIGVRNDKITAELFARNLFNEFAQTYGVTATGFTNGGTGFRNIVLDRNNTRYIGARIRYNY